MQQPWLLLLLFLGGWTDDAEQPSFDAAGRQARSSPALGMGGGEGHVQKAPLGGLNSRMHFWEPASPEEGCVGTETQEVSAQLCGRRATTGTPASAGRRHHKDNAEGYGR